MDEQGTSKKRLLSTKASLRSRAAVYGLFAATFACSMFSSAATTDVDASSSPIIEEARSVPAATNATVELYQGPQVLKTRRPKYPKDQLISNGEGWVVLQYMVGTTGKPYEISVVDSVGSKQFSKAATRAMRNFTFQPAMANGQPIDAGGHHKMVFALAGGGTGARSQFVRDYKKASKAINTSNKIEADSLIAKLKITNLYEDAFYNYIRSFYYEKWGTPRQALAAVRRAVAHEESDTYLRGSQYLIALQTKFGLEVELNDFTAAERTAELLLKHEKDDEQLTIVKKAMQQIAELRTSSQRFTVTDNLGGGTSSWFGLFRNKFQVSVAEGEVAELKLRCRKGYVFFRYDPELEYSVPKDHMPCGLEILGNPGTQFSIEQ